MRSSCEIVWELGAVLKSKGNLPLDSIYVTGPRMHPIVCCSKNEIGDFLGNLFTASLSKVIRDVNVDYWVPGKHCGLSVMVEDSPDGRTNIDDKVVEAFSKLKWKW